MTNLYLGAAGFTQVIKGTSTRLTRPADFVDFAVTSPSDQPLVICFHHTTELSPVFGPQNQLLKMFPIAAL